MEGNNSWLWILTVQDIIFSGKHIFCDNCLICKYNQKYHSSVLTINYILSPRLYPDTISGSNSCGVIILQNVMIFWWCREEIECIYKNPFAQWLTHILSLFPKLLCGFLKNSYIAFNSYFNKRLVVSNLKFYTDEYFHEWVFS